MEHLLLLLVGDPGFPLKFICRGDPTLIVAAGGVIGINAARSTCHHLGRVGAPAVVLHGTGIKPCDFAPALFRSPVFIGAVAPNDIEGGADYVPGAVIVVADILYHALGELDQGKPQKGSFRVSTPVNIAGGGLLTAGTAGIEAASSAGGIGAACFDGSPLDTARAQLSQRRIGNDAVSPVNGVGQLVPEQPQCIIRGIILRPVLILGIDCAIQRVLVQLAGVALSPVDADILPGLLNDQCIAVRHSLPLELGQLFSKSEVAGNDVLIPAQPGRKLPSAVPLVGDAGQDVRQVDKDILLIHPAGLSKFAAFPAGHAAAVINGQTDFDALAAAVLQQGEGEGGRPARGRDGGGLRAAALSAVNGQRLVCAVPASGAGDVDLEITGGGVNGGAGR